MNTMTRQLVVALSLAVLAAPAFADSEGVDCNLPQNARFKHETQKRYQDMLAHDKAGRARQAYDEAVRFDVRCIAKSEREIDRMENERAAVIKRSSLRLGEQAEKKGRLAEAYKYYEYFHGLGADRVQMKLATAKPGDFKSMQAGISSFSSWRSSRLYAFCAEMKRVRCCVRAIQSASTSCHAEKLEQPT